MDFEQSKRNLSSFEKELDEILIKGSEELKHLYFNLGITIESQAKDIGIYRFYIRKNGVRINNVPNREDINIKEQDLIYLLPNIKHKETLKIISDCALIYKSPFFEKMKSIYDGFVGLIFSENELRFENIELTREFKEYKANIQKEKLECELTNKDTTKKANKAKI